MRTQVGHGAERRARPIMRGATIVTAVAAGTAAVLLASADGELSGHLARLSALTAALALWLGDIGSKGASALLLLVFVDLLGLVPAQILFDGFAQPGFLFLLAVLFISTAIGVAGTTARVGQRLLASALDGSRRYMWQLPMLMLGSAALVSSATARVSLMHPVLDELVDSTDAGPGLRRYLTLFVANLNPLTSRAFLSGGPGIVVAAELMGRGGYGFGWGEWVLWLGFPVALIFAMSTIGHLLWLRPGRLARVPGKPAPFTCEDRFIGVTVAAVVLLWVIGPAFGVGAAAVAVLGMATLAFLPQGGSVFRAMPWDVVLFAGATLSFAGILLESGTATWLGELLFGPLENVGSPYLTTLLVFTVLVLLRLPLSNGISYSAMVFPIVLSLGDLGGLSSLHIAFMALVAGGLVFLPVQSSPTMISYASGRYGPRDTVASGLITFVAALVVFQWLAVPYWHWLAR